MTSIPQIELLPPTLVVIPTLNEARNLRNVVEELTRDLGPDDPVQIIVADGGSTDGTQAIARELRASVQSVTLIDNPDKLQSAGINRAVSMYGQGAKILIRCDAHSGYPPNFIRALVAKLESVEAESIVVPMDAVGDTCKSRAIAWVSDSLLGSGGSAHRGGRKSGYVDHGHHAAFRLDSFCETGGYDSSFGHNEDAEFDYRFAANGGRIYLAADIRLSYQCRSTFGALWKQYRAYGRGRSRTIRRHPGTIRLRQLAPPISTLANCLALIVSPLHHFLLLIPCAYVGILAAGAILIATHRRSFCGLMSGPAALIMHLAWSVGFLQGLMIYRERSWADGTKTSFLCAKPN